MNMNTVAAITVTISQSTNSNHIIVYFQLFV